MQPSISLIVCFHNAESTLERTLKTLNAQTTDDVEYIFVDDGSTDRSIDVLEAFLALNPDFALRHKLIRTNKLGLAHATRTGILNASGRYITRCDADDFLEPDAMATMIHQADKTGADVAICEFLEETDKGVRHLKFRHHPLTLNDYPIDTLHFSVCNKLISRKLLIDNDLLSFEGIDCWEDLGLISRVISLQPKVVHIDRPLYHYVSNPGSLSRSHKDRLISDHLKMTLLLEDWFAQNTAPHAFDEFLLHLKFAAKVKMMRAPHREVARWKHTFPEVNGCIMQLRHVALRHRILFAAVNILPSSLTQHVSDLLEKMTRFFSRS